MHLCHKTKPTRLLSLNTQHPCTSARAVPCKSVQISFVQPREAFPFILLSPLFPHVFADLLVKQMHWGDEKTIVWLLLLFEARVMHSPALSKFRPRWLRQLKMTQDLAEDWPQVSQGTGQHLSSALQTKFPETSEKTRHVRSCKTFSWGERNDWRNDALNYHDLALPNSWGLSLVRSGLGSNLTMKFGSTVAITLFRG